MMCDRCQIIPSRVNSPTTIVICRANAHVNIRAASLIALCLSSLKQVLHVVPHTSEFIVIPLLFAVKSLHMEIKRGLFCLLLLHDDHAAHQFVKNLLVHADIKGCRKNVEQG